MEPFFKDYKNVKLILKTFTLFLQLKLSSKTIFSCYAVMATKLHSSIQLHTE